MRYDSAPAATACDIIQYVIGEFEAVLLGNCGEFLARLGCLQPFFQLVAQVVKIHVAFLSMGFAYGWDCNMGFP